MLSLNVAKYIMWSPLWSHPSSQPARCYLGLMCSNRGCGRMKRTCPLDNPSNPSLTANILWPSAIPTLTAERTAAFIPAAGAPTFNTATLKELCGRQGSSQTRIKLPPSEANLRLHRCLNFSRQLRQTEKEKTADVRQMLNYLLVFSRLSPWPHVTTRV